MHLGPDTFNVVDKLFKTQDLYIFECLNEIPPEPIELANAIAPYIIGIFSSGGTVLLMDHFELINASSIQDSCFKMFALCVAGAELIGKRCMGAINKAMREGSLIAHKFKMPGAENISLKEFKALIQALIKFKDGDPYFIQNNNKECVYSAFLKFLKQNALRDELIALVKLGAKKSDCFMQFFEAIDAGQVIGHRGERSLTWLAAKAVSKANPKIAKSLLPEELFSVVTASKPYAQIQ